MKKFIGWAILAFVFGGGFIIAVFKIGVIATVLSFIGTTLLVCLFYYAVDCIID